MVQESQLSLPHVQENSPVLNDETFHTLMETTNAGIFFYRGENLLYVNSAMEEITGYQRNELIQMKALDVVHPGDRTMVRERAESRLRGESPPHRYELKVLHKSGETRWIDLAVTVVTVDGAKAIMGTALDITARKKFEDELRRSEELTHRIIEAVPGGIVEFACDGSVLQANIEAQRFCGLSALDFFRCSLQEHAAKMLWEDGSPVDSDDVPAVRCLNTGLDHGPLTIGVRRPDGGISWGIFTAVPLIDIATGSMTGAVQTFLDITGRKHMEDALRESEERYRRFFEEDLTGDFIASSDGCLLSCNPSFATIFGFESVESALYSNLKSLFSEEHPYESIVATIEEQKKIAYYEAVGRRRDEKPVYIIANLIGLFDSENNLIGIKGYLFDNTAHKLLEQHVQESARIEGLGRLAGGIAHDFNNLLGIIIGYSDRLNRSADSVTSNDAQAIRTAAMRGASLVKQLLTFARKAQVTIEEMNLNSVVDELGKLLKETFPRNIELVVDIDPALPLILGDTNTIHQAILNLCVNARDAMPNGGELLLRTETVAGTLLTSRFPGASSNEYACLSVSDSGVGMDDQTREKIFEPFFSTKERTKGTGLGLAVVYGIVNAHQGFVDVHSQPGKGASFKLFFPIPTSLATALPSAEIQKSDASGGNETILVVEDEEALRDLVQTLLETKGYTILSACDGDEAVALFRENREKIDLVLTDLGLPKLDGWNACRQMLALQPALKVVIASGYLDPDMRQEMIRKESVIEFVHKPYLPSELITTVRSVLDRPIP